MEETDRTGDFAPWWKIVSSRDATPRASGSYAPAQRLPFTLDTVMLHSQPIDELQVKFSRDAGQTVQVCPSTGDLDSKQLLGNVYSEARLKPKYSRVMIQRPHHTCNGSSRALAQRRDMSRSIHCCHFIYQRPEPFAPQQAPKLL